jgi:hypothetical protein
LGDKVEYAKEENNIDEKLKVKTGIIIFLNIYRRKEGGKN